MTHFSYRIAKWVFPVSRLLHWLGVPRTKAVAILARGISVRVVR